ncbi:MAG: hypothetical protein AAB354_01030 [candidate division KSB1 bacterium]
MISKIAQQILRLALQEEVSMADSSLLTNVRLLGAEFSNKDLARKAKVETNSGAYFVF